MKLSNRKNRRATPVIAFVAAVILTGAVTTANAQTLKAVKLTPSAANQISPPVSVVGCLIKGVEAGCMMLKSVTNGQVYNVSSLTSAASLLNNKLPIGAIVYPYAIAATGTVSTAATTCMQGTLLVNLKNDHVWTPPPPLFPTPISCK